MSDRLSLAMEAGLSAPDGAGAVVLWEPVVGFDLPDLTGADPIVVHDKMPEAAQLQAAGFDVRQDLPTDNVALGVTFVPRAKAAARDRIARMAALADVVVVDGQKTDGIDSLLRDVRKRTEVAGTVSKAHGKAFWFSGGEFSDWLAADGVIDNRWHVRAGVFSADGVDPGSRLLADALTGGVAGRVADLGAGWGYLAGQVLAASPKITEMHLVEAQGTALDCARLNVTDARAQFHWTDATDWRGAKNLDVVIMNPPFHTGRTKDLGLGQRFVQAAAALLRPRGQLFMVANRHLPYEATLTEVFAEVSEIAGDGRYKILHARKQR